MGRLIIYEGGDEEIRKYLSSLTPQNYGIASGQITTSTKSMNGAVQQNVFDQIAQTFCSRIKEVAANGRNGQYNAMMIWLKYHGEIELSQLWKASGVKSRHDYGGIGSSLTRNMKKSGGPKKWYTFAPHPNKPDDWVYTIIPELADPLKSAFGV